MDIGTLALEFIRSEGAFSPSHTVKRTITEQRGSTP